MTRSNKRLVREQCYGPRDLSLGAFIHVYGRDFFLHDADDFTKHWYSVRHCPCRALAGLNQDLYQSFAYCQVFFIHHTDDFTKHWHYVSHCTCLALGFRHAPVLTF